LPKWKELALYIIFGMATTLVHFIVFESLQWIFEPLWERSHWVTNPIGFIVALVFAYVVNKLYVFEQKSWESRQVKREIATFTSSRVFAFALDYGLVNLFFSQAVWQRVEGWFTPLWLSLPYVGYLPERIGPMQGYRYLVRWTGIAALVFVLNYIFTKWVVFKKKEEPQDETDIVEC